jgi:hypothetical protein
VISGSCPAADGFSNNKRSNGSKPHPLKSAFLISRVSWSEVRPCGEISAALIPRLFKRRAYCGRLGLFRTFFSCEGTFFSCEVDSVVDSCVFFHTDSGSNVQKIKSMKVCNSMA